MELGDQSKTGEVRALCPRRGEREDLLEGDRAAGRREMQAGGLRGMRVREDGRTVRQ